MMRLMGKLKTAYTTSAQRKKYFYDAYMLASTQYGELDNFSVKEMRKYILGDKELNAVEQTIYDAYAEKYGRTDMDEMPFWDNKLNIYDENAMKSLCAAVVTIEIMKLDCAPVTEMNLDYYRDTHKCLYDHLYPWAGEIRDINITRSVSALKCIPYKFVRSEEVHDELNNAFDEFQRVMDRNNIENALISMFDQIGIQNWNRMDDKEKIARLLESIGELWRIHPFLHGNIMTELYFIVKFCEQFGMPCKRSVFKEYADSYELERSMILAYYEPNPFARIINRAVEENKYDIEKRNQNNDNDEGKKNWAQIKKIITDKKAARIMAAEMAQQEKEGMFHYTDGDDAEE